MASSSTMHQHLQIGGPKVAAVACFVPIGNARQHGPRMPTRIAAFDCLRMWLGGLLVGSYALTCREVATVPLQIRRRHH